MNYYTYAVHLGDPDAVPVLFWALVAAGVVAGILVFALLKFPRLRRFGGGKGPSRPRLGAAAGLLLALLASALAWQVCWSGFFTINIDVEKISLHYLFPMRVVELGRGELETLGAAPAFGGPVADLLWGGPKAVLVVRTRDGRSFSSTRVSRDGVRGALEEMSQLTPFPSADGFPARAGSPGP